MRKVKATTRTYFEVVHLTAEGDIGGGFANEQVATIEGAREIIRTNRIHDKPNAEQRNVEYWARQNYGIQEVTKITRWIESDIVTKGENI